MPHLRITSITVLLFVLGFASFLSAGTVPWLTGNYEGGGLNDSFNNCFNSLPGSPPSQASFSSYTNYVTNFQLDLNVMFSYSSLTTTFATGVNDWNDPLPGPWCTYSFEGSISGTIAGTVNGLTFTGEFLNGTAMGEFDYNFDNYYSAAYVDGSFDGFWSNGMHSTGTFHQGQINSQAYGNGWGYVDMFTTSPEPTSIALFATGLLPIIGAIRRHWRVR